MKKSIGAKTLVYPAPVFIVGTYGIDEKPNAAACAWAGICCSKPPCVSVSFREATLTYNNILQRKAFTINIPSEKFVKEADYFGIASGKTEDKFSVTKLTSIKSDFVDAPYIGEFPLVLECALLKTVEIGLHTLFIGEVKDVKVEEAIIGEDGFPEIEKIKSIIFNPGSRTYYVVGRYIAKAFSVGREIIGSA